MKKKKKPRFAIEKEVDLGPHLRLFVAEGSDRIETCTI